MQSAYTCAVLGAGLMGRLVALSLARQGTQVSLFDKGSHEGQTSAAYVAAGMLAPFSESLLCETNIVEMGKQAPSRWASLLTSLDLGEHLQQAGTLLVAHEQDKGDFLRFQHHIEHHYPEAARHIGRPQLTTLEPELAQKFHQAIYLPDEGQVYNRQLLRALHKEINRFSVQWHAFTQVNAVNRHSNGRYRLNVSNADYNPANEYDMIIDCRGAGACARRDEQPSDNSREQCLSSIQGLRAVRGELFVLNAPQVNITRPIRLMHPRYHLYIVPKPENAFVIGATEIESDDSSPMTVRSALELLSAAYSVHPGFAEATITQQLSQLRPAYSDNQPRITVQNNYIQINGLFRHGYLIAPIALQQTLSLFAQLVASSSNTSVNLDISNLPFQSLLPVEAIYENNY